MPGRRVLSCRNPRYKPDRERHRHGHPEPADTGTDILDVYPAPALHSTATAIDAALAAQHRAVLAAATADNTRRAYRSAVNHYLAWGGVLPADEAAIIRYLLTYAPTLNPRTLALRLTALSQWHVHQAFPDPASTPTVRKTLTGIARTHGRPKKKAKALPIEDLERIVAQLASAGTLRAARDNALLQIGFFGDCAVASWSPSMSSTSGGHPRASRSCCHARRPTSWAKGS